MFHAVFAIGGTAHATTYTETVPNGNGPIPATYPAVGGTMFVFIGQNGNKYYQFVNPSTQFEGFQLTGSPAIFQGAPTFQLGPTQALNCGTVTCSEYFGGSIVEGYVRLTARDGDSCNGNFDYQDLTFSVNGIAVSSFSDLPANSVERTDFSGMSSLGFEDCFRDQATTETSTGWFDLTGNTTLLDNILSTGSTTPTITDADGWQTNGQGDNRWFFTDGNDATGTPEVAPGVTIEKSADVTSYAAVGDIINYEFLVTNIGSVTLTNVGVSDTFISAPSVNCPQSTLTTGESMVCTAQHTVTQANIDNDDVFVNTAEVSAAPTEGTIGDVSGTLTIPGPEADVSGTITKEADVDTGLVLSNTVTYTYEVTNTGNVTWTDVTVSDVHGGSGSLSSVSPAPVTLAPGASQIFTTTYTITQADIDAGATIDNTASISATPARGTLPATTATETINLDSNDELSIVKPAPSNADEDGSGDVNIGDTLTYIITVTNSGTTTQNNVVVSDNIISPNSNNCATVAPGGTCVLTGTYSVTQADVDAGMVDNTAAVISDEITTPVEATNNQPIAQTNELTIVKPAPANADEDGSGDVTVGDTLSYTITATNSGSTTMNNVVVSDPLITPNSEICATLIPGATCVLTGDYVVTQSDVDSGTIDNTASVVSNEITTPIEASNSQPVAQSSDLTLVKPAPANADEDGTNDVSVGDTLTYTVTATNSGTITLNNVIVSDLLLTPNSNTCGTVVPGATCVLTGDYIVAQVDVDAGSIDNTAAVESDEITTPVEASNSQPVNQTVDLSIVKPAPSNADEDGSGDVSVGDTLTYTITATNSGTTTLTNVVVMDVMISPNSNSCSTLAPGATCVLSGDYTVTQADVDNGSIDNTAMTSSTEVTTPVEANQTQAVGQTDELSIIKPAPNNADEDGSGDVSVGDTLTYTVTATNSGTTTLSNVVVSDSLISPSSNTCTTLAPGATCVLSGDYTVTQTDVDNGTIDNTAGVVSAELPTPTEATNTTTTGQTEELSIIKPAPANADEDGSGDVSVGDTLTYTVTATNSGTTTLSNVVVSDSQISPSSITCAMLAPGATCVLSGDYTVTQVDVDNGSIDNTAGVVSTELTTPTEATNTTNTGQNDALSIVKPAPNNADEDGSGDISVGDTLTYTITATNSGTTTLTNVIVSDNLISPSSNSCATLAPSATCILVGSYTVTQADIDNAAIDNTAGVVSNEITTPVEATNTSTPNFVDELSIVKPAPANADEDGSGDVSVGDTLTYTVTATNSGTTTLSNIVVSDNLISPNSNTCTTLAPGATCVLSGDYTVTQADVDNGSIDNIAGVVSAELTTPTEATNTTNTGQNDALSIVKPAPNNADEDGSGNISVDDTLTYTITATNSGTTTLTNVVVSDNLISPNSNSCASLTPGGTCILVGTYTVTQADIDNAAIDNTAGVVSNEITTPVEATNTSTPNFVDELSIVKPAPANADEDGSGDVSVGDTLTYTVTATNSGTTTLSNVVVSDLNITPSMQSCTTLAPGATCVLTGDYTVTQADIDNGSVDNIAMTSSSEITTPEEATNSTTTGQNDALSIVKPAPNNADEDGSGDISVGDTLTYTITATNSGTTTLTNVVVSDNLISPNSNTCASLTPGGTCILVGTYTVTQADIDNAAIDNTAGVVSNEITTPVEATNTSTPNFVEELSIVKPAPANADEDGSGDVSVGDTLTYTVTATNSGTTTLSNVVVSDNLISPNSNTCTTLAPGATCVLSGDYTVTQADVDNGSIDNTAGVVSAELTTPTEATNTTNIGQTDELSIVKPAPANADQDGSGDVSVGDTLTYTITATNSGTTTLTDVTVTDNLIQPGFEVCASVAPGATCVLTGTYTVTQTDIDNASIVNTATVISVELPTPVQATNTVTISQTDELSIVKPAPANADEDGSGDVSVGDTLTYTVTATNSGSTTLTNVIVSDNLISPNSNTCASLAPGATCVLSGNYTVTQTDIDNGSIANTAGVTSNEITTPEEATNTTNTGQFEELSIVKPAPANADEDGSGDVSVGDSLTYTVTATNSGTTTLTNVVVSDNLISPNSNTCAALAPNATCVLTGTYTVTQTDVDNGSIVNTAGVTSNEITTPEEATNTTNTGQTDELSIVKPAPANADEDGSGDLSVGDTLTYTVTATNSGTTTLTNVIVSDNLISPNSNTCAALAPSATCELTGTYTVSQADVDAGSIVNIAGVTSNEITTPVEATNTANTGQTPALSLVKPAPANADEDGSGDVSAGDTLTYTLTATNSGTVTLSNVVVTDLMLSPSMQSCTSLAVGADCVLTGTYTVTQTDVDNGAIDNTAMTSSSEVTTPVSATQSEPVGQTDELSIVKPAPVNADEDGSGDLSVGDTLTYTVTATNSGTTTLGGVVVSDALISPNSNTCATLAPGATCVLSGTYTVTQTDVDNGSIANTAGVISNEISTPVEATNTSTTGQVDALSIAKPAPVNADEDGSGDVSVGDTLTYTVTATNSGTTTLTNVIVSDALIAPNSNTCASLAPNATCVLSGTYTVTQADVDNGSIDNTAGVVSSEITTPETATNSQSVAQAGRMFVTKPAPTNADEDGSGDISVGDTLSYSVRARNSGTITLTNVIVSDPMITPNSVTCAVLLPGDRCDLDGTYTVTQADIDNGSIVNTANAVSNEVTTPEEVTNTSPTGQTPALSLVKPAPANADEDGSGDLSVGDTLTYTITATNAGTVTLTNVIVSDAMITPNSNSCASLAPGATCVLTGSYTVTQADVDAGSIANTASVESTEVTTPVDATNTSNTGQSPELSLVKPAPANADEDGSGDVSLGDTLTYTVTATNSGTVTLTNVIVSDALITPNSETCASLLPGATCVLSGTYTITQADIDNGSIANTASVVSNEVTTPVDATNNTNTGQTAELGLVKPNPANADEDGSGNVSVGDTLTYTITATNTGSITLSNVVVSDPLIAPNSNTCAALAPGATCVLTGSYSVTQADVDNGSIANTASVASTEVATPVDATNTVTTAQASEMTIAKPAPANADEDGSGDVSAGDTLTYTVTATNSGTVTLTNVVVSDALITPNSNTCAALTPGATCVLTGTYTVSQADVDAGSIVNTAGVVSSEIATPIETSNTQTVAQNSGLEVTKPAPANADEDGSGDVSVGDTLTYTVTATNTGSVSLSNVVVSDAMITPNANTCAALLPGASCVLTGTYTVTQADVDAGSVANTASATSNEITNPVDASNTQPVAQNPALGLVKAMTSSADSDNSGNMSIGDTLTYTITATNTGDVTLTNVTLSDPMITPASRVCASLAPGATCVLSGIYSVTQTDLDSGSIVNTANVSSPEVTTPVDASVTETLVQNPALTLAKPAPANGDQDGSDNISVGDVLTYTITATNSGNVTLTNVVIMDVMTTPSTTSCASVAVGASCVLTGNYTVTQADVDAGTLNNTAQTSSSEVTTPVSATVSVTPVQTSGLSIIKPDPANADEDGSGDVSLGDTLTYTVTATNTGTLTLTNVVVSDPLTTPNSQTCAALAPGATCVLTGNYVVAQTNVDAGTLANTASVTSNEITNPETVTNNQSVARSTGLVVNKPAPVNADEDGSGDVSLGDTLTYTVSATNTGSVTLTNVVVTDLLTTPTTRTCAVLAPGAACVLTGTYTVTQADVDAGAVQNSASATSNEVTTPVDTTQTQTVAQDGSLLVEKTGVLNGGANGYANIDDTITYTFTVTNTGVVTLTDIVLEDALVEVEGGPIASLAPGETDSTTFTATYFLDIADIEARQVINNAIARGRHPNGELISGLSDDPSNVTNDDGDGDGNPDDPTITNLVLGPTSIVQPLTVTKTTPYRDVSFGDLVPYEITITNNDTFGRDRLIYLDRMPNGFAYAPGTTTINGVAEEPVVNGNQLTFPNRTLAPNEEIVINMVLVVGSGVNEGEYTNRASVISTGRGTLLSDIGEATVIVGPSPVFDCSELIGKVFDDRNLNGYQDHGEPGIPDVRVVTVKGELITTDEHGRYHIACAEVPNSQIGSNYIVKLDPRSLPTGYRITTENPRVVRLTRGKMTKLNFGAAKPRVVTLDLSNQVFQPRSPLLHPSMQANISQLMGVLKQNQSILRINYHAVPGEPQGLVTERLKLVSEHMNYLWEEQSCCYDLIIETKMMSVSGIGSVGYRP